MEKNQKIAAILFSICISKFEVFPEIEKSSNRERTKLEYVILTSCFILDWSKKNIPDYNSFRINYMDNLLVYSKENCSLFNSTDALKVFIYERLEFYHYEIINVMFTYSHKYDGAIPIMSKIPYAVYEYPLVSDVQESENLELIILFHLHILNAYNSLIEFLDSIYSTIDDMLDGFEDKLLQKYPLIGFYDLAFMATYRNYIINKTGLDFTVDEVRLARINTKKLIGLLGIDNEHYDDVILFIISIRLLINKYFIQHRRKPDNLSDDFDIYRTFFDYLKYFLGHEKDISYKLTIKIFQFIKNLPIEQKP